MQLYSTLTFSGVRGGEQGRVGEGGGEVNGSLFLHQQNIALWSA